MDELPAIGVFGTGPATKILVPHLRKSGFKIEAIWGKNLQETEEVATQLEISFATNKIDDVLLRKDVDMVLVLSPPSLHSQIAVKALGIGKHVVVQAPAGISQSETLRQVQASQYYPSLISIVAYCLRFLPAFTRLRKVVLEEDLIGSISLCDVQIKAPNMISKHEAYSWACDEHMGGGILNQFGSHIIDILQHVTGLKASRVHGTLRTLTKTTPRINGIRQISSEDFATFQMECGNHNLTTISLNATCPSTEFSQSFHFHGSKGDLFVTGGRLTHIDENGTETVLCKDCHQEVALPSFPGIYETGFIHLFDEMADKLHEGNFGTFNDALYVQAVMEAIRNSSKNKSWTKVSLAQW